MVRIRIVLGAILAGLTILLPSGVAAGESGVQVRTQLSSPVLLQGQETTVHVELTNERSERSVFEVELGLVSPSNGEALVHRWVPELDPGEASSTSMVLSPARWFPDTGTFAVRVEVDGILHETVQLEVGEKKGLIRMEDVTTEVGINTQLGAAPYCYGGAYLSGAAWGDVEGDGDLDLYVPHWHAPSQLWINAQGSFHEEASQRGVEDADYGGVGAVFGDYDNDGDQDLYVVNTGANRLYVNDGTGHFVDVAEQAGVASNTPDSSAAWGDYDGDGDLDLYVTNWGQRCTPPSTIKVWT